jgi:hypothetical protein
MKARTNESTNRPDIRLQPNLNAFDQLLASSAWLREESIYHLLGTSLFFEITIF